MGRNQDTWRRVVLLTGMVCFGPRFFGDQVPSIPPGEFVRRTVQNEVKASQDDSVHHMFLSRKETGHGSQTKMYCETKDAMAGMAVAYDDQPLTNEQRLAEEARLDQLMKDPDELKKKREREKEDADRVGRIVRAMPDAFLFDYDGTQPGAAGVGKAGDELVRLRFRPNPKYDPPTRTEQVLEGMQGYILIDAGKNRIAKIDGTLFKDVGFGWGILGHLDRGGYFLVEQGDLGDGSWDIQKMSLAFTGRILFFKRIDIKSTEVLTDFRPVPRGLSFAEGVDLLKKEEATVANNGRAAHSQR